MRDIPEIVRAFRAERSGVFALATLVRAKGSSYRRPGARMLISRGGNTAGSLSAGCLEDEVAAAAQEVMTSGEPCVLVFDTRRRFGCNGSIEIFVERLAENFLPRLMQYSEGRTPFVIETVFEGVTGRLGSTFLETVSTNSGALVQQFDPPIRLLIIGSGPDANALRSQAHLVGWDTVVMESIAEAHVEVDEWTVAVVATHNYGRDCAALRYLLPLGLAYLGVIGPRRRRDELLVDVLDSGAIVASKFFAPAGLHLGAESPGEIALSIVAEIQSVLTNTSAVQLRDRRAPIHEPLAVPAPVQA